MKNENGDHQPIRIPVGGDASNELEAVTIRNERREALRAALRATLADWRAARSRSAEKDLNALDAHYATHLGLPALAATFEALGRLEAGLGPLTRDEAVRLVNQILTVLLGECQARINLALDDETALVPGASQVTQHVLEAMLKFGI